MPITILSKKGTLTKQYHVDKREIASTGKYLVSVADPEAALANQLTTTTSRNGTLVRISGCESTNHDSAILGPLAMVVSAGLSLVGATGGIAQAGAGGRLLSTVFQGFRTEGEYRNLTNGPLAYAAFFKRRFGPH